MNTLRLSAPHLHILAALLVQLVVLAMEPAPQIQQGANLFLTFWISAAAMSITGLKRVFWVALALGAIPAVLELAIPYALTPLPLTVFKELLWMAFPLYVAGRVLLSLLAAQEITHHEVSAAVALYILLGMAFGNAFALVQDFDPGAIVFSDLAPGESPSFGHFVYFSFITLSTTGYGDVAPVHPAARTLSILESLLGLMYLSILVARLVTLHTGRKSANSGR